MQKKTLQDQIKALTQEIERLSSAELKNYEADSAARSWPASKLQSWGPLGLFLVGVIGFTLAYFSVGEGPLAYLFIFGIATPGVLWFMIGATKMPRWRRWRTKEDTVKQLNQLVLEKSRLIRELRRLEGRERKSEK